MKKGFNLLVAAALTVVGATPAYAEDLYLGQIITTAVNFCPRGTLDADGKLLSIQMYPALFSLLGTAYGGDGRTTFALPDMRARSPIGDGPGPGLKLVRLGDKGTANAAQDGDPAKGYSYLGVRFCVVTQGIFPSRN